MKNHITHFDDCGCLSEWYLQRISKLEARIDELEIQLSVAVEMLHDAESKLERRTHEPTV